MSIAEIHTRTLKSALSILEGLALSNDEIVFRGHSRSDWRICSTLSRYSNLPHANWDMGLDEMLSHFLTNLKSIGELPAAEIARDRRARLEYGRHYGVPSPLIDFSHSPYVALFFAFDGTHPSKNRGDKNVVVCALNVRALGIAWAVLCTRLHKERLNEEYSQFIYEREPLFANGYPAGVIKFIRFPASWNKRMQRQMGTFVYDSIDYPSRHQRDFEDFVSALIEPADAGTGTASPILTKVFIPRSVAGEVFTRLELMGVNATRLLEPVAEICTAR